LHCELEDRRLRWRGASWRLPGHSLLLLDDGLVGINGRGDGLSPPPLGSSTPSTPRDLNELGLRTRESTIHGTAPKHGQQTSAKLLTSRPKRRWRAAHEGEADSRPVRGAIPLIPLNPPRGAGSWRATPGLTGPSYLPRAGPRLDPRRSVPNHLSNGGGGKHPRTAEPPVSRPELRGRSGKVNCAGQRRVGLEGSARRPLACVGRGRVAILRRRRSCRDTRTPGCVGLDLERI